MPEIEAERYELREGPFYRFTPDRREFLTVLGGGLVILLASAEGEAQESGRGHRGANAAPQEISAWLQIAQDGRVRVFTGKAEVGQNARTALTQAVAEELRCPPEAITMVMADTALTPYDAGTFGSRTTPTMAPVLRKAAAAARETLVDWAAQCWHTSRQGLTVENGCVRNPASGQSLAFAELANGQALAKTIPSDTPLTPAEKWTVSGKSLAKINGRAIVTGQHRYASDITRPEMVYGAVVRPPAYKATLISADSQAAERMPGVRVVRDGNFLGVTCVDAQDLPKALAAVKAEWNAPSGIDSSQLFEHLKKKREPGRTTAEANSSEVYHSATYTVPYIAHVPLETRAAVAEWDGGKLTVWTGTQRPFGVRSELAGAFGIPEDRVRVIVPDTGSGYGGKHTGDAAIEAARLAKSVGKPVKVVWTREEEFRWAYFRPAGVIDIRSGAGRDGTITSWECHNYNSGPSGLRSPYQIPNQQAQFHEADSPLRQGSYRGLAATANHFARESHMDELARKLGLEPLAFRLKNTTDARLRAIMEAAARQFGWGSAKSGAGKGFGFAAGFEKGGYVACCAEVHLEPATQALRVVRVVEAFECGAIVNPEQLRNQIEGGVLMGLGGALYEAIDFANGRVRNATLSAYRVPRFLDVPQIETVLVDRKDLPSAGAGETPIVGIAPAIANAIVDAGGPRLRSLPLSAGLGSAARRS
jgi:nicotinate dehydrogenase subunit B